ncbi:hypothetical protein NON20_17130 [Synechocystis sp. B12]|jgi:hypothetical protein|nr:hypothetical protein NON20_17130 [Synechocystis sp. B12]
MITLDSQLLTKFIDTSEIESINRIFDRQGKEISPFRLTQNLNLIYEDALYILLVFENMNLCDLYLEVYHKCSSLPIKRIPFGQGFPEIPFFCDSCQTEICSSGDLSYNFMAIMKDSVYLI